jgi:TetR/AcrR family transcriptional repressor of nem operon
MAVKESTKSHLIETGKKIFLEKGYGNAGIEGILQAAGVPKGSFYYYFKSKEDFGLQVLDSFGATYHETLAKFLDDESLSPLDRLRHFFEARIERLESQECRSGCLVGNLSQEMADHSEAFRLRLEEIFEGSVDRLVGTLRQAQEAAEISTHLDVRELAEFWLNSWQGAILRAKTMRSTAPLRTFMNVVFNAVLQV